MVLQRNEIRDPIIAILAFVSVFMAGDFMLRGVKPSFSVRSDDLSDPFVGARVWRRGGNPYDLGLVKAAARDAGLQSHIVPIYPPATYLFLSPLSPLPWEWANFSWALLGLAAIGTIAYSLVRIGQFTVDDRRTWCVIAFVFSFRPFHTALEVGNAGLITAALCIFAVDLARCHRDFACGILLAIAACMKPQDGVWILVYYLVRMRWRIVLAAAASGIGVTGVALARAGLTIRTFLYSYLANLHYWFRPGGKNDFSAANAFRFPIVNLQVALSPLVHQASVANRLAFAIFGGGLVIWLFALIKSHHRSWSDSLPISSLLALSFLAVYHRVNDSGILTLSICWLLAGDGIRLKTSRKVSLALMLILAVGQSALIRLTPYLGSWITDSSWWNLIFVPYFIWTLLALSVVLLYAVVILAWSAPARSSPVTEAQPNCAPVV